MTTLIIIYVATAIIASPFIYEYMWSRPITPSGPADRVLGGVWSLMGAFMWPIVIPMVIIGGVVLIVHHLIFNR